MSQETTLSFVRAGLERLRTNLLIRLLAVFVMAMLLQIPIGFISQTIDERRSTRQQAMDSVTETFGGPQTIIGPVLSVPTVEQVKDAEGKLREVRVIRHLLPESLEVHAKTEVEVRRRGIFDVPLYVTGLALRGKFHVTPALMGEAVARHVLWAEATVCLGVSDPRAIREASALKMGNSETPFEPGPGTCEFLTAGIHAAVATAASEAPTFSIDLSLGGSGRLAFVPVGSDTAVKMEAPWPSPSFDGAFLPRDRDVSKSGFSATWRVLHLDRNFPVAFDRGEVSADQLRASAFGVSFFSPVDAYRTTERAVKYQILFLGLTAGLFLLFELLSGLRVHPVQYLLIGLALCLFYLLLLSLAEHIGFLPAYALAAWAITSLVGAYGVFVLNRGRRALILAGLLAGLYGFLFVLLKIEDYALLVGSLGLFVVLATVMFLTRRVDWYGRQMPAPPPPVGE